MIGVYWSGGWGSVWLCTCVAATCVADCVRVPLGGSSYIHVCVCGGGGGQGLVFWLRGTQSLFAHIAFFI